MLYGNARRIKVKLLLPRKAVPLYYCRNLTVDDVRKTVSYQILLKHNVYLCSLFSLMLYLGKQKKITKQYKDAFIIFAGFGFLESCGRKISVPHDGRHSGNTLCASVFLRCRCNVTVEDCKNSTVWNRDEDEVSIDFVRNNECQYNVKCEDYRKIQTKQTLWTDVETALHKSGGRYKLNKINRFIFYC